MRASGVALSAVVELDVLKGAISPMAGQVAL